LGFKSYLTIFYTTQHYEGWPRFTLAQHRSKGVAWILRDSLFPRHSGCGCIMGGSHHEGLLAGLAGAPALAVAADRARRREVKGLADER